MRPNAFTIETRSHASAFSTQRKEIHTKESIYKTYDELPLFLNAETVAKVLGVSPSSGYELMHQPDFPTLRVGNRMVVPKEQFIRWVEKQLGGAK